MEKVANDIKFSSEKSIEFAVEILQKMINSMSPQIENNDRKYSAQIIEAIYQLLSPLLYTR